MLVKGLIDVRGNVRLWGMESEIKLHDELSAMEEHKNKTPTEISEMVLAKAMHLDKRQNMYETIHKIEYDGII